MRQITFQRCRWRHFGLAMDGLLSRGARFPCEAPLEKTKFSFVSGYQLKMASGLGMGWVCPQGRHTAGGWGPGNAAATGRNQSPTHAFVSFLLFIQPGTPAYGMVLPTFRQVFPPHLCQPRNSLNDMSGILLLVKSKSCRTENQYWPPSSVLWRNGKGRNEDLAVTVLCVENTFFIHYCNLCKQILWM